jgi:hypothetical protein
MRKPHKATAHKILKPWIAKVMRWNREDVNGLDYRAPEPATDGKPETDGEIVAPTLQ